MMGQLNQFIINHWELWAALVIILLLIFINEVITQKKQAQQLSPTDAVNMINHENALVIDLREPSLFQASHIINAIRASSDDFTQQRMDKYKTKPFILVCARGLKSQALATQLRERGFQQPMVLAGGMAAWLAANLPVINGNNKK